MSVRASPSTSEDPAAGAAAEEAEEGRTAVAVVIAAVATIGRALRFNRLMCSVRPVTTSATTNLSGYPLYRGEEEGYM